MPGYLSHHDIIQAIALSPPPSRLVVVHVESVESEVRTTLFPVVAVEARQVVHLANMAEVSHEVQARLPDLALMLSRKWAHVGTERTYGVVVMTAAGDLLAADQLDTATSARKTVPCPWPVEEDARQLAPVVAELAALARARVEASAAAAAAPPPVQPAGQTPPRYRDLIAMEQAAEARRRTVE